VPTGPPVQVYFRFRPRCSSGPQWGLRMKLKASSLVPINQVSDTHTETHHLPLAISGTRHASGRQ
jgi:hypothetical protein